MAVMPQSILDAGGVARLEFVCDLDNPNNRGDEKHIEYGQIALEILTGVTADGEYYDAGIQ